MFKIIFTAIMLLVIFVAGASYLSYLKKGTDMLPNLSSSTENIKMPSMPSLESLNPVDGDVDLAGLLQQLQGDDSSEADEQNITPISKPLEPTYKWLENGSWHYANEPPEYVNAKDLIRVE